MRILKKITIFVLLLLIFFVIDISLSEEINILPFEILTFAFVAEALIFWSNLRLVFILVANVLFFIMILFFILNMIDVANIFGSLGFGILIITAVFYLPQIVKKGYIEEI